MNRTTGVLMAVAAAMAAYLFLISPLDARREEIRESLAAERASLVKHKRFIEKAGGGGLDLDKAKQELKALERNIIRERDTSLAYAKLQGQVQDYALKAEITITSIKPLSPENHNVYTVLPIFLDSKGTIEGLSRFLRALDAAERPIAVDKLTVNAASTGELRIRIQISGLMIGS